MKNLPKRGPRLREKITVMIDDETHEMIQELTDHPDGFRVPEILRGILKDGLTDLMGRIVPASEKNDAKAG